MRRALALFVALLALATAPPANALRRPLRQVEAAIVVSAPNLPARLVREYARVIRREAAARSFDPYTVVGMVNYESHWQAGVEDGSHCIGLGQVCLTNYRFCTEAGFESPRCLTQRASLKVGTFNLRVVAGLITVNRKFCRRKTGKPALFARWLSSYQGYNRPRRGIWCNMVKDARGRWCDRPVPRLTRRVIMYRRMLQRKVGP